MKWRMLKWISKDLAIDLGTANTLVYVRGKGIMMNEPSVLAVDTQTGKVLAVGNAAKEMIGMTSHHIKTVRPLKGGVIADFRMTETLLRYLIKKIMAWQTLQHPRMVIAIPFGVTDVERQAVRDLAIQAGASEVALLLKPVAAALGAELSIQEARGNLIVDVGGGTTEVAIISLAGIVRSHLLRTGGDKMDEAIIQYIKQRYNLLIGFRTAERLKKNLGSAYPFDLERVAVIRGQDMSTGVPIKQAISSKEIREALAESVLAIIKAIKTTLETTPPEFSKDILERGMLLTGGAALLHNLDFRLQQEFRLPVTRVDNPLTTVANGVGRVLSDRKLLQKVAVS